MICKKLIQNGSKKRLHHLFRGKNMRVQYQAFGNDVDITGSITNTQLFDDYENGDIHIAIQLASKKFIDDTDDWIHGISAKNIDDQGENARDDVIYILVVVESLNESRSYTVKINVIYE